VLSWSGSTTPRSSPHAAVATRSRTAASEEVVRVDGLPRARARKAPLLPSLPRPPQRPASAPRRASSSLRPEAAGRGGSAPPARALGFEWGLERRIREGLPRRRLDLMMEG
jgi:hypothetical protein